MSGSEQRAYLMSPELLREIASFRKALPGMVRQMVLDMVRQTPISSAKEIRCGTTVGYDPEGYDGEGAEDPEEYPESPANTFWVKLGKPSYPKEAGEQELEVEPYDPPVYRLAHHPSNVYVPEGTDVWIALNHGQYYILPEGGEVGGGDGIRMVIFALTGPWSSGVANADFYLMDNMTFIETSQLLDPLGGGAILAEGDVGYAFYQDGNYYFPATPCPAGEDPEE